MYNTLKLSDSAHLYEMLQLNLLKVNSWQLIDPSAVKTGEGWFRNKEIICNVFVLVASAGHWIRAPYSYISMQFTCFLYFGIIIWMYLLYVWYVSNYFVGWSILFWISVMLCLNIQFILFLKPVFWNLKTVHKSV